MEEFVADDEMDFDGGINGIPYELKISENPILDEFFSKYPTEESWRKADREQKKEFAMKLFEKMDIEPYYDYLRQGDALYKQKLSTGLVKSPYEPQFMSAMALSCQIPLMDQLFEEIQKLRDERKARLKGIDLKEYGVVTKICDDISTRMNVVCNEIINKKVEEVAIEAKFPVKQFLAEFTQYMKQLPERATVLESIFMDSRTSKLKAGEEVDQKLLIASIKETNRLMNRIIEGEISPNYIMRYTAAIMSSIFNYTNVRQEEHELLVREVLKNDSIEEELLNLIVQNAFIMRDVIKVCQKYIDYQKGPFKAQMIEALKKRAKELEDVKERLNDPIIKNMVEKGIITKGRAVLEYNVLRGSFLNHLTAEGFLLGKGVPPEKTPPKLLTPRMTPEDLKVAITEAMPDNILAEYLQILQLDPDNKE